MEQKNNPDIKPTSEFPSFLGQETVKPETENPSQPDIGPTEGQSVEQPVQTPDQIGEEESITIEPDVSPAQEQPALEKTDETLNDALVHQSAETSSEASYLNDIATGSTPEEKLNSIL